MNGSSRASRPAPCRWCGNLAAGDRGSEAVETFCCVGCALRARIPVDADGQFPVNAQLTSVLAVGFLYFNELLFWTLGTLGKAKLGAVLSERMLWVAAAAALLVWLAVRIIQRREKCSHGRDIIVSMLVLAVHVVSLVFPERAGLCMAGANAGLLAWSARGLIRKKKTAR